MDTNSFAWWLHGFFEISESNTLSEKQVQVIKDHLDLCFNKVTPDRSKEEWSDRGLDGNGLTGIYVPKIDIGWVQPYLMQESEKPSGFNVSATYWLDKPNNTSDYYITVSKKPNFDSVKYSAYSNYNDVTSHVKTAMENAGLSGKFTLVIDDSLNPTGQYAKGLSGDKNMIRGVAIEGPGLVNIGFGIPLLC